MIKVDIEKKLYIDYLISAQLKKDKVNINAYCLNYNKEMNIRDDTQKCTQINENTEE